MLGCFRPSGGNPIRTGMALLVIVDNSRDLVGPISVLIRLGRPEISSYRSICRRSVAMERRHGIDGARFKRRRTFRWIVGGAKPERTERSLQIGNPWSVDDPRMDVLVRFRIESNPKAAFMPIGFHTMIQYALPNRIRLRDEA